MSYKFFVLLVLLSGLGLISCKKKVAFDYATMDFVKRVHNFDTLKAGSIDTAEFKFTNASNIDLTITQAFGTCGCTTLLYPTQPVKAGENAVIKVIYDSDKKIGIQQDEITIISNTTTGIDHLMIKAFVEK